MDADQGAGSAARDHRDDRHHRQRLLAGWGAAGQARVGGARVLVVGVGATGGVSAELLARAGVGCGGGSGGRLVLVDRDVVEPTNLQRQVLYAEADLGRPKADAAADRLRAIDGSLAAEPVAAHLDGPLAAELCREADAIVDGTDNFETRYVLSDAACAFGVPLIYGGAVATRGTVMPVLPGRGPCLRCLRDAPPRAAETCDTAGVLGPAAAWVGARQAALTLRWLVERDAATGPALEPRLESMDAWTGRFSSIDVSGARRDGCPCCGAGPGLGRYDFLDGVSGTRATALCGRNSVQIVGSGGAGSSGGGNDAGAIDLSALAARLAPHGAFSAEGGVLRGELRGGLRGGGHGERLGLTVFADGRAIVHGTEDRDRARAVYDRYVGG